MPSLNLTDQIMFRALQCQLRQLVCSPVQLLAGQISKILISGLVFLLAACADDIEKLKLSEAEEARIQQLQNPFGENHVRVTVPGEEQQVLLGLKECKVYRAKIKQGMVTQWTQDNTLSVFYPMWSACSKESLKHDGQYINLSFCKTPIGAGGGCAGGGGDFRSINGKDWQLLGTNGKWESFVNRSNIAK